MRARARLLPDGRRLHLQDGPIDLIVEAFGHPAAVRRAYEAASRRFSTVLDELCDELPKLRAQARPGSARCKGPVAQRMLEAVAPFAIECFITPMAAVAGSVADGVLCAMTAETRLDRAYVNNGGDIALYLAPGESFAVGLADELGASGLFGSATIRAEDGMRGIATSGWRGRSFSFGIADAVTVIARTASEADAAATIIANAVDLPGHPAVTRRPARDIQCDSDLGERPVTQEVVSLGEADIARALARGSACAEHLMDRRLVGAAALHLQGRTVACGMAGAGLLSYRKEGGFRNVQFPASRPPASGFGSVHPKTNPARSALKALA